MRPLNDVLALRFIDFSLRFIAIPLCVASLWITVTNKQVNDIYGKLEFSNLTGLKYLVCINAIGAGYALLGVGFSWVKSTRSDWVFFVSDQVLAYLMLTAGSAATEILYLGYVGDREVSWSEACTTYSNFCRKTKVSLILHMMSMLCFFVLAIISAYGLFHKFEPPYISSKEGDDQTE